MDLKKKRIMSNLIYGLLVIVSFSLLIGTMVYLSLKLNVEKVGAVNLFLELILGGMIIALAFDVFATYIKKYKFISAMLTYVLLVLVLFIMVIAICFGVANSGMYYLSIISAFAVAATVFFGQAKVDFELRNSFQTLGDKAYKVISELNKSAPKKESAKVEKLNDVKSEAEVSAPVTEAKAKKTEKTGDAKKVEKIKTTKKEPVKVKSIKK